MKVSMCKTMRTYEWKNLSKDLLAGLVIMAVSIPISMGYAQIAGLPAVYGLYGSVFPIVLFALFSTSPQFVFGVDAAPAALVGSALVSLGIEGGSKEAIAAVPVLAFFVAVWLLVFYLCRAGKLVNYISAPVMGGFISGICTTIILMQVPKLFGGKAGVGELPELVHHIWESRTIFHLPSLLLGVGTLVILLVSKKLIPKFPMAVFLMAGLFIYMMMRRTVEQMEKLQEVAEKQELLMGALSHEMRTPLTSIIGYSDTLRHVKLKDEQKDRALEHINREGKRLEALSGKMLQMLGLYQNHAIQMEMTMAGDLLNHVIDMEKEQAEKKAVHLKMECEAFSMKMDPALMESLLINLIDNALKATDAGGSIWVKAYEKAGKKIFEVSDTGMGIPEEELGKITDAFYMVDKSRSRKEGGSGLGLALCVKVAEIHGGCLKIESRQREGTTVRAIF